MRLMVVEPEVVRARRLLALLLCLAAAALALAVTAQAPWAAWLLRAQAARSTYQRVLVEPRQPAQPHLAAGGAAAGVPRPTAQAVGTCSDYVAGAGRHVSIAAAAQLQPALEAAVPGDVVELADGVYDGMWVIKGGTAASGQPGAPITLCGGPAAVLRGPAIEMNQTAVLLLADVSHWRVLGLTIENGYKAVWAQGVQHCEFRGLTLRQLGEEGIRLCFNSTHNSIEGCAIHDAGLWIAGWGEGIYIGTSQGQWVTPDQSSFNRLRNNRIGPGVAAECIDLKEWTEGHVVEGNVCDGRGLKGDNYASSLISIKASHSVLRHNLLAHALPPEGHGINTVVRAGGWGDHNVFDNNTLDIHTGGYGIRVSRKDGVGWRNVVKCSNVAPSAGSGLSNVACTP